MTVNRNKHYHSQAWWLWGRYVVNKFPPYFSIDDLFFEDVKERCFKWTYGKFILLHWQNMGVLHFTKITVDYFRSNLRTSFRWKRSYRTISSCHLLLCRIPSKRPSVCVEQSHRVKVIFLFTDGKKPDPHTLFVSA